MASSRNLHLAYLATRLGEDRGQVGLLRKPYLIRQSGGVALDQEGNKVALGNRASYLPVQENSFSFLGGGQEELEDLFVQFLSILAQPSLQKELWCEGKGEIVTCYTETMNEACSILSMKREECADLLSKIYSYGDQSYRPLEEMLLEKEWLVICKEARKLLSLSKNME